MCKLVYLPLTAMFLVFAFACGSQPPPIPQTPIAAASAEAQFSSKSSTGKHAKRKHHKDDSHDSIDGKSPDKALTPEPSSSAPVSEPHTP